MKKLQYKGESLNISNDVIGRCIRRLSSEGVLIYEGQQLIDLENYTSIICRRDNFEALREQVTEMAIFISEDDNIDLQDGDIVSISRNGHLRILYSPNSSDNVLFITETCNHKCIMCSQPPKKVNDLDAQFKINSQLVDLIPDDCEILGITGGEPTLLGDRLFQLYEQISTKLPNTIIHTLTNGRAFNSTKFCDNFTKCMNGNLIFGIPLYSDYSAQHDYIVQSKNAFNQTIKGIYNLAALHQKIEIRIVVSKLNHSRLIELAHFIYKNLPFVDHVAFMGLEDIGNATINSELIWIDPKEYIEDLNSALEYLFNFGINTSIYNIPLCLLPSSLWKHSAKSISDWKTKYLDCCNSCKLVEDCCGVFGTSQKVSSNITPFIL